MKNLSRNYVMPGREFHTRVFLRREPMERKMLAGIFLVGLMVIVPGMGAPVFGQAASAHAPHRGQGGVPIFELDPTWPPSTEEQLGNPDRSTALLRSSSSTRHYVHLHGSRCGRSNQSPREHWPPLPQCICRWRDHVRKHPYPRLSCWFWVNHWLGIWTARRKGSIPSLPLIICSKRPAGS